MRLDLLLVQRFPGVSRARIQKLIDAGTVRVNDKVEKKRYVPRVGDVIRVDVDAAEASADRSPAAEALPLDIIFEDDTIIVVNKPAGMVVHPGAGNRRGTLVNALLYHAGHLAEGFASDRPGIVHRLDKDTSGVMVVAKNAAAHAALASQFACRMVEKKYVGFCIGGAPQVSGIIDQPIGRSRHDPLKRVVRPDGKSARTSFRVIKRLNGIAYVEFSLHTGRTHQIRAHCANANMPVVGDRVYGGGSERISMLQPIDRTFARSICACFRRQALHARVLGFSHPVDGRICRFSAALPSDFTAALALFGLGKE